MELTEIKTREETADATDCEGFFPEEEAVPEIIEGKEPISEANYADGTQPFGTDVAPENKENESVLSEAFVRPAANAARTFEEVKIPVVAAKENGGALPKSGIFPQGGAFPQGGGFPQEMLFGKDVTDKASVIFGQSEDEMRREFKAFKAAKLFKKFDCDLTDVFSPEVLDQKLTEAKNYGFGGVVVTPQKIRVTKEKLRGSGVEVVAAVCFPFGEEAFGVKKYAVKKAVEKGADRVYVPVGISTVKFNATDLMKREFKKIIKASKRKKISAVIESGMMTSAEVEKTVRTLNSAGVMSFVSSTGFFGSGEGVSAVKNIRYYLRSGSEVSGFTASRRSDEAVGLMSVADRLFVKNAAELAADIKSNLKY